MIPERAPQLTDRQLEWGARKAAGDALQPGDVLLDIEVGNLKRFRDNGVDKPVVTPKAWARALPVGRGLMTVTYTGEQVLFLSDGLAVNCSLVSIHRAQLVGDRHQLFAFAGRKSELVVLEFEQASSRRSARPEGFLTRLVAFRDRERAKLPAQTGELLERIDAVVQAQSVDELWARPSAPISLTSDDLARLAPPAASARAGDGIDEVAWSRLLLLASAAHREDAGAYAELLTWEPPDFGLPGQHRTGVYLLYLLNHQAKEVLANNKPTAEQLHFLADTTYPRFRRILGRAEQVQLEETLRTAFEMPPLAAGITPAEFTVFAAAVVGLLLDNPGQELAFVRPRVAAWWKRNHDNFVREGLKE